MRTLNSTPSNNDTYFRLVKKFPLKTIQSDEQYDQAISIIECLLDRHLDSGEEDYLDALTTFVESYERALPEFQQEASFSDVLKLLMASNGDTQASLSRKTTLSKSLISELLSGTREITLPTARKLAAKYSVPVSVFINRNE